MKRKSRNVKGNVLVMITVVLCLIFVPAFMLVSQFGLFVVERDKASNAVDGACLLAANGISRIVINDPHFGYVSLSNYPPTGAGTLAVDGEPLPVIGINTLLGTIRQNMIVAKELNNKAMEDLAETDRQYAFATINELNKAIANSLDGDTSYVDAEGDMINIKKEVDSYLAANLPSNVKLQSVSLSCGYLKDADGSSSIKIPEPKHLAQVPESLAKGEEYKPFTNIPFNNKDFHFAGLGSASKVVTATKFQEGDKNHINSIVRLAIVVNRTDSIKSDLKIHPEVAYTSCCQPYARKDAGPKGVLTLRFSGEHVSALSSWKDLLADNTFLDNKVTTYKSFYGDYPLDSAARMYASQSGNAPGTSKQFGEHFYYWLRNGNLRPKLSSILSMVNDSFNGLGQGQKDEIYTYEFASDGKISRRVLNNDPFPVGATADSQEQVIADTNISGGINPVIVFRNNVRFLGTKYGGNHAGQPLPGKNVAWCELPEFNGDEQIAMLLGKGKLATQLLAFDKSDSIQDGSFTKINGGELTAQPRKSYYSGGLAMDIEIGGLAPKTNTPPLVSISRSPR